MKNNNKKIIILLVFVISLFSLTSLLTYSRYSNKTTLTGSINSTVISINFNPNGDSEYKQSQSATINVTHKASTEFATLKYGWFTTSLEQIPSDDFTSGDEVTKTDAEGIYYLCVYAEDINGLHNSKCSEPYYVDSIAPTINITTEGDIIVVEVEENGSGIQSVVSNDNLELDHVDGNKYYFVSTSALSYSFTATDNANNSFTKDFAFCSRLIGTVTGFDYTGGEQNYPVSCSGKYKLETWGAQGGSGYDADKAAAVRGGYGGYSVGIVDLGINDILHIYVGQEGQYGKSNSNAFGETISAYPNSGSVILSKRTDSYDITYSTGGGSTHVTTASGLITDFSPMDAGLLIVAGAGGGTSNWWGIEGDGGDGGGYIGNSTTVNYQNKNAGGGTQTAGGAGGGNGGSAGAYGLGGGGTNTTSGAGGGGYYGGGASWGGPGAGGSGYVANNLLDAKHMTCYNCQTSSAALTATITTTCYSNDPITDCAKGKNGYARITYMGDSDSHTITLNSDEFTNHGTTSVIGNYYNDLPNITVPSLDGYSFTGYYDNQDAFDLTYTLPTAATNNIRIDFLDSSNNWSMTNADAGTHINAKIIVNSLTMPKVQFNDIPITSYKTEVSDGKIIIYLDFDITLEMVTNTNYNYETQYRFIDLEFGSSVSPSIISIDHITKNGSKYYDATGKSVFPYNKNINTLYAHKINSVFNITYDLAGGSVATANPTTYNYYTESFTLNNPTKNGYTFTGWTGSNGTTPQTTITISKGSTGNRSYTANWTPVKIKLTLDPSPGSGGTTALWYYYGTSKFYSNEECTTQITAITRPTRNGYTFVNYHGDGTSGGTNNERYIAYDSTEFAGDLATDIYKNATLYASWTPTSYSISYTLNSGSATNPTSYNIETSSFTLNNPTRNYYTFTGWSGTGLSGSANKTVTIAKGSTGNRSYTANWTPTNYSISYTLNGGSVSGNPTSYNVETANFTLKNPSRTGYTFTGWTGTGLSSASTSVTVAKGSTGNRSYTANWKDSSKPGISLSVKQNTVSATLTDNVGVVGYGVNQSSTTQPSYTSITSATSKSISFTKTAGTYYLWVKDAAGNYTNKSFTIAGDVIIYNNGTRNYNYKTDIGNPGNGAISFNSNNISFNYYGNKTLYFTQAFANNYRYLKVSIISKKNNSLGTYNVSRIFVSGNTNTNSGMPSSQLLNLYIANGQSSADITSYTTKTLDLGNINQSYYVGFHNCDSDVYINKIWLTNTA